MTPDSEQDPRVEDEVDPRHDTRVDALGDALQEYFPSLMISLETLEAVLAHIDAAALPAPVPHAEFGTGEWLDEAAARAQGEPVYKLPTTLEEAADSFTMENRTGQHIVVEFTAAPVEPGDPWDLSEEKDSRYWDPTWNPFRTAHWIRDRLRARVSAPLSSEERDAVRWVTGYADSLQADALTLEPEDEISAEYADLLNRGVRHFHTLLALATRGRQ